ncbi:Uncharacterized protein TPAR_01774 [Tolypocladium paradoxum]|uniref:DUF3835 domain-containing protein n=1 Tax=Tolypocladium paradoxum TaxID=94208 RepID=A0A2S4L6G5_9HYPO|nr:Uncharacterized protein TPAR_01774 [Tolypocladium paradoxum]
MSGAKDSFLDLERHRLRLEENVKQLRKALQHWHTWDAEYEALKEEVEAAPDNSSEAEELHRIRHEFEGELLHGKEVDEIFGLQELRPKDQIINVLQRRVDYVTKNIESLQKLLETAENKHAAATAISQPDAADEDVQPITEIIEELDADDNVLSYRLNRPGDSVPHIKDALEKAGVKDLPDGEPQPRQQGSDSLPAQRQPKPSQIQPMHTSRSETVPPQPAAAPKKTVSFSEDAMPEDAPTSAPAADMSRRAKRVEQIMKTAKEQESISNGKPVIPEDEDPDDADLRQQMLQYSMGEVGAVVAELQLEEGDTGDEGDGFDYSDDDLDDDDYADEDRYGRSTGRVVTEAYRQRMLELEKSLGIKSRFTQATEDEDSGVDDDEGIGRILVKHGTETPLSASKPAPSKSSIKDKQGNGEGKKGVRFAQSLDITPVDEPAAPLVDEREELVVEPLSDIVERSGPSKPTEPKAPRTRSRFMKARDGPTSSGGIPKGPFDVPSKFMEQEQREIPTGPGGTTLADRLVEREPTVNAAPPDEFDDSVDHNAVADEYQRMRKKFIQRQGGFLKEDESIVQELDEAEGGPERMSRFKAARLSRQ